MSQATLGVNADMSLHAEIPLIAFLGLMHLGPRSPRLFLVELGASMMVASEQRALLHYDTRVTKPLVEGVKELAGQLMLLQQMTEVHDGSAVRNGQVQGERHQVNLVESIYHGTVAEVVPLLHAVNAEHGVQWVGTMSVTTLEIDGLDNPQHV